MGVGKVAKLWIISFLKLLRQVKHAVDVVVMENARVYIKTKGRISWDEVSINKIL
jgi:hypothetical protein